MKRKPIQVDRDKLRAAVRKLGSEYVFYMLDDAIELLPPAKLYTIAKKYLDLKPLYPDAEPATRPSLLMDVKGFEKASLAGEYYESFFVNSKNYREQSAGTSAWIAPKSSPKPRAAEISGGCQPGGIYQSGADAKIHALIACSDPKCLI
jgi:hypothetical protein